jgi:hypothetical protein
MSAVSLLRSHSLVTLCLVILSFVTTGLDPVVHDDMRLSMDCRVKPGNDELTGPFVH